MATTDKKYKILFKKEPKEHMPDLPPVSELRGKSRASEYNKIRDAIGNPELGETERNKALKELESFVDDRNADEIVDFLLHFRKDPVIDVGTLMTLGEIAKKDIPKKVREKIMDSLSEAASWEDVGSPITAVRVLGSFRGPAVKRLVKLLDSKNFGVSMQATNEILNIDKEAIKPLLELFVDANEAVEVRSAVGMFLAVPSSDEAGLEVQNLLRRDSRLAKGIVDSMSEDDISVKSKAVEIACYASDMDAIRKLGKIANDESEEDILKTLALLSLAGIGQRKDTGHKECDEIIFTLLPLLESHVYYTKVVGVMAEVAKNHESALDYLISIAQDPDYSIKIRAGANYAINVAILTIH